MHDLERMVTEERARRVAIALFPGEATDGGDCRMESGREGHPCAICAERNDVWLARVQQVHAAMIEALR